MALVCLLFTQWTLHWTLDGGRTEEFISNEIIGSGDYNVLKHSEDYGGPQHSSHLRWGIFYELTSTRDRPRGQGD